MTFPNFIYGFHGEILLCLTEFFWHYPPRPSFQKSRILHQPSEPNKYLYSVATCSTKSQSYDWPRALYGLSGIVTKGRTLRPPVPLGRIIQQFSQTFTAAPKSSHCELPSKRWIVTMTQKLEYTINRLLFHNFDGLS